MMGPPFHERVSPAAGFIKLDLLMNLTWWQLGLSLDPPLASNKKGKAPRNSNSERLQFNSCCLIQRFCSGCLFSLPWRGKRIRHLNGTTQLFPPKTYSTLRPNLIVESFFFSTPHHTVSFQRTRRNRAKKNGHFPGRFSIVKISKLKFIIVTSPVHVTV